MTASSTTPYFFPSYPESPPRIPGDIVALDFESYYDDDCSVATLGPGGYFNHPQFDPYMISLVSNEGFKWVSDPRKLDWTLLSGKTIVSHNASFDEFLYYFGVLRGWWDTIGEHQWVCTADMAAYLGSPRSLAMSVKVFFNKNIDEDKKTRDAMKGKRWENMDTEFRARVIKYALADSEWCLKLWMEHSDGFPESERFISKINRRVARRGIPIDQQALDDSIVKLRNRIYELEHTIPWHDDKRYKLLSRVAFNRECTQEGLEPPASLAQDNPESVEWIKEHEEQYPWIRAFCDWRRVNSLLKKLESFDRATIGTNPRFYGNLMYFGAHTGRFSGSGGNLNLQNLPRGDMFGVNLRSLIKARPGHKLVVVDLSQIEVRTTCWLSGDHDMLRDIANSPDVYETFAIRFGLWEASMGRLSEVNPGLRSKPVKPMVLGCGFGAGWRKLGMIYGLEDEEAQEAVDIYRSTMRPVVEQWASYDVGLERAHQTFQPYTVPLPSGREIKFSKLKRSREEYEVEIEKTLPDGTVIKTKEKRTRMQTFFRRVKGGRFILAPVWGGIVMENCAQGLARDVFVDRWRAVEEAGYDKHVLLHVHDELVLEVPEEMAHTALHDCERIMSISPDWIPDLPLAAEGQIVDVYTK